MPYKRILVPIDGGETSGRALRDAVRIARSARAKLRLLHVVEEYAAFSAPELAVSAGPVLDAIVSAGRNTLARAERRVRRLGIKPETALIDNVGGRVADEIVWQAKRWRADLIVMGTHGRRGLQRAMLGSDAELVVRYAPVPVLVVPVHGRGRLTGNPRR